MALADTGSPYQLLFLCAGWGSLPSGGSAKAVPGAFMARSATLCGPVLAKSSPPISHRSPLIWPGEVPPSGGRSACHNLPPPSHVRLSGTVLPGGHSSGPRSAAAHDVSLAPLRHAAGPDAAVVVPEFAGLPVVADPLLPPPEADLQGRRL